LLLFILTENGGSGDTLRHKKQITHIIQNNTTIKRNTTHKTTHTTDDTLQSSGPKTRQVRSHHETGSNMVEKRGAQN
jgi:hypothetical protein